MCRALRELIADGEVRGEDRVSKLTLLLMDEKRYADLERASKEKEFRNQLFKDFGI
ncbi:MAG: hypothetical protein KH452_01785 [Clostridiales bacterium]|nr:hypothetical protein [Clostridiales bacterium]